MKVSDFGMAKVLDSRTQLMSTICGTPAYTAPEVFLGQKYDCSCDIWSLGVVLYVMLCGYPPFDSESNEENRKNMTEGNLEFHSPDWDEISANGRIMIKAAKDLLRKMINPTPSERITAEGILKHPWLVENSDTKLQISEKLRKYNARRKLRVGFIYVRQHRWLPTFQASSEEGAKVKIINTTIMLAVKNALSYF